MTSKKNLEKAIDIMREHLERVATFQNHKEMVETACAITELYKALTAFTASDMLTATKDLLGSIPALNVDGSKSDAGGMAIGSL